MAQFLSETHAAAPLGGREPPEGLKAQLVANMLAEMRGALDDGRGDTARDCLARLQAMLEAGMPVAPAQAAEPAPIGRGRLLPWQMRRVDGYIEQNLDSGIAIRQLAGLVSLSSSYFCRAFKGSFGEPPHAHIMRRRVERAQTLMLSTADSLSQIALACGLADQAHLSRLFRRIVGESPGLWRRAHRGAMV